MERSETVSAIARCCPGGLLYGGGGGGSGDGGGGGGGGSGDGGGGGGKALGVRKGGLPWNLTRATLTMLGCLLTPHFLLLEAVFFKMESFGFDSCAVFLVSNLQHSLLIIPLIPLACAGGGGGGFIFGSRRG